MKFQTKHKKLEENLFADMVVLVGRYMEYGNIHSRIDKERFVEYYKEKESNIIGRCIIQRNVIKQAKKFYEEKGEFKNITYSKVRRIFRKNLFYSFRIRTEQYYFWKFVMDYILENNDLLDVMLKELMIECKYYSPTENIKNPDINCLQQILDWYYVRIAMNNRIFCFDKNIKNTLLSLFSSYEHFPEFKSSCRFIICNK